MNNKYINIYNNLVYLTRNKELYQNFREQDTFSDRLILFLFHFGFFLKTFKKNTKKKILQEIYDYIFKQLEFSIREIGYGDVSVNKKMKIYLNIFYSILDKINSWEKLNNLDKNKVLSDYLNLKGDTVNLAIYFDKYRLILENNALNSFIKGVINLKN